MAWSIPWNFLGVSVSGDLGDYTVYENRHGKKVAFKKVLHQPIQSQRRLDQQTRFREAQAGWKALADSEKLALEDMARRLSLYATGQNIYISVQLTNDVNGYATLEKQSGISLPPFSYVPWPDPD